MTNSVWPREHTGHSKHPFPTTQEMTLHMDIIRWSIPKSDWLYSLQPKTEKLYTVTKTRPGDGCGSAYELIIAKLRLKLKKVEKTTGPFRYDLNPLCLYSGSDRFKGLDMIECQKNCGWRLATLHRRQWYKSYPGGKGIVWGGIISSWEKKWNAKEKRREMPTWMQSYKG